MTDRIIELHLQGLGRFKISQATGISEKRVRTIIAKYKQNPTSQENVSLQNREKITFQGTETIIDKVIRLTPDQKKTKEDIMKAVGFSPDEWECTSAEIASWNGLVKGDDSKPIVTDLYSVRVKVRPKKNGFDLDKALEKISRLEPVKIEINPVHGKGLLEVGITDAHFGANTFEDYQETLAEVLGLVNDADEVLLILGSDNLHTNNFQNTTVKGTVLEPIDLEKAFDDAFKFFGAIIYQALSQSKQIHVKYIRGNHDETTSFLLCKTLQAVYQTAEYDLSMEQYKVHRYHDVCIGLTHGDNGQAKNYDRLFRAQFPEMGTAKVIELHAGHLHREMVSDVYGTMVRTLPTGTERTGWTKDKGYHSVRRFQCFLYGEDSLKAIYYV